MGYHSSYSWRRRFAVVAAGLLAIATLLPGMGRGAAAAAPRPVVVLTGTIFPAGLGLGVAVDPIGLQAALWTPLVGFDDHLRPYAALAARVPTLTNGDAR